MASRYCRPSDDWYHSSSSIVFGVTKVMLILLLRGQADSTERIALFLADLVLSPLLFVGAALLYFDQAARVEPERKAESRRPTRV